ncbi:hypothetical protein SLEP1_g5020 [Rubroshorea leprosula]|uniref:Neprosin domain-containing protein n=1 Tax=Rubroshorea leprosula TaxID=152421 RepID=A0AAV5HQM4_9ROSI|nr:hypothetical protein SLEP1_g5020 [Rubroshorea leprosula]
MVVYLGSITVAATNFYPPNNALSGHGFSWSFSGNFSSHIKGQFEDIYEGGWMEYCFEDQCVAYLSITSVLRKTLIMDAELN